MAASLSLSAMNRLLRKAGAKRVSETGKKALAEILEDYADEIGGKAAKLALHAGRKTVTGKDIKLAVK